MGSTRVLKADALVNGIGKHGLVNSLEYCFRAALVMAQAADTLQATSLGVVDQTGRASPRSSPRILVLPILCPLGCLPLHC